MISSRTPEGDSNLCPLCGKDVVIESSLLTHDAPCPHCGHLLWFIAVRDQTQLIFSAQERGTTSRMLRIVAEQLGVSVEQLLRENRTLDELGADSLDVVELVMELEEESGPS
ncbi:Acyl carrier protein [Anatilimnocola aggregata]|uniref:Acyl carrier protein n=1 Tax=Anatilimnocola aggregata TaxID=2528021 RepID=A0A517Y797_9BACT|nr:Acyl carrier protein [Anatilimnocola aggregata]